MKKLILLLPLTLLAGCSSTNITKLTTALAKDPATVVIKVNSIYGTASVVRVGNNTNQMTISPDGTVSVGGK